MSDKFYTEYVTPVDIFNKYMKLTDEILFEKLSLNKKNFEIDYSEIYQFKE